IEELDGIPYPTIAKRVKSLVEAKVLRRTYYTVQLVGRKAGFTHRYRIDVTVNPSKLHEAPGAEEEAPEVKKGVAKKGAQGRAKKAADDPANYTSQKGLARYIKYNLTREMGLGDDVLIEDVQILLGTEPDLSVDVYTREPKQLLTFVTEGLRKLRGVLNTRTAELAWSIKDHQES
ncbi:MAG TPA: hypothetical protein VF586_00725, partial [Pyrinomonadaceae bacterium]